MTGNNPKLDLVNDDVHTKFGPILSICSQDIEQKQNSDVNQGPEWILGFCKDGPTPPSHSQKGAKVESSRAPYQSAFSQEDLHKWSTLVFNQQKLFTDTDFTNHQQAK